jgi:hydrogenase nickel incorporation protein HypB
MCASCGCGSSEEQHGHSHEHGHSHGHAHLHEHVHPHEHEHEREHEDEDEDGSDSSARRILLEAAILAKNDAFAAENRARFAASGLAVLNLTSSPGSGKTTLLERVIGKLGGRVPLAIVEGDQETDRDAQRIRAAGASVVQINTRTGCHLDARMVRAAVDDLRPPAASLVLIENVGNLVCPALFDLGERAKVVLMSVTEGEDKPLKYPHMFRAARVLVLSKIDLLPYLDFDVAAFLANAQRINAGLRVFALSARSGEGVASFCDWLASQTEARS